MFRLAYLVPTPTPFDALDEWIPSSYCRHIWHQKTRMAELQSVEHDSHTATAIAALAHCTGPQKLSVKDLQTVLQEKLVPDSRNCTWLHQLSNHSV